MRGPRLTVPGSASGRDRQGEGTGCRGTGHELWPRKGEEGKASQRRRNLKRALELSRNLEADTGGGDVRVARLVQVVGEEGRGLLCLGTSKQLLGTEGQEPVGGWGGRGRREGWAGLGHIPGSLEDGPLPPPSSTHL